MTTRTQLGLLAAAIGVSNGCADDFTPYNQIGDFRVLAMKAEPPQVPEGATATLEALVFGDGVSYAWSWCPPSTGPDLEHTCVYEQSEMPVGLPPLSLGTSTTATFAHDAPIAAWEALCDEVSRQVAESDALRVRCDDGVELHVRLEVRRGDARIVAIKRLALDFEAPPSLSLNTNPRLSALSAVPNDEGHLALELRFSETEAQLYFQEDVEVRETIVATWFVTSGETEKQRTTFFAEEITPAELIHNTWMFPFDASGTSQPELHVVVRDERGGTNWISTTSGGTR